MVWRELWAAYWKRIIGAAAGLLLGIIYLISGFWDMLIVGFLVAIGYWIGKHKESSDGPLLPWQKLWDSLRDRFRPYR
ncbi:DUF2273 domain-containing protein [Paenibacillus harenae]|uniref:Membrane protein n=1 Tax=Paenibacillus harenae TaxID=306543 RepID=A0ABT9TW94_PAEHA|nr:DUF2273 domain-containing protein [Paenibacillus harenae]MDQ0058289.1 putative membrane protein [Paenibacillus harenae]MDQ0111634.1 putative membrane protein [Paenibacillus harenae]